MGWVCHEDHLIIAVPVFWKVCQVEFLLEIAVQELLRIWYVLMTFLIWIKTHFYGFFNEETRCELHIFVNGQALPFRAEPTYLCKKLDSALTHCRHLESLPK